MPRMTLRPLKKISFKHREVMRRLIMNQSKVEIAMETGYTPDYINFLVGDPLFEQEMDIMEAELQERFMQRRGEAMDILHEASMEAAKVSVDAMRGKVKVPFLEDNEEAVPVGKRLDSAWDVLDRTGNKAPTKSINLNASLQDLLIESYERHKNKNKSIKRVEPIPAPGGNA